MNVAKMLRKGGLCHQAGQAKLLILKATEGHQTRWFGRTSNPLVNHNKINGLCCEKCADKAGTHRECCEDRASDFQSGAYPAISTPPARDPRQTGVCASMGCTGFVKPDAKIFMRLP